MRLFLNFINRHKLGTVLTLGLLVRLILAPIVWHPDLNNHVDWGIRFWQYGPQNFYSANVWNYTWPNQPPGTIYMFGLVRKLYEVEYSAFWWVNTHVAIFPSTVMTFIETNGYEGLLKLPSILADIGIAYCLFWVFASKLIRSGNPLKSGSIAAALYLFNPVVLYNSAVWGQTDSIINCLALLSFILLFRKRLFISLFLLLLSFYVKASLLIFAPFYILALIALRYDLRRIVAASISCALLFLAFTAPFASKDNPAGYLIWIYTHKVFTEQLQIITANAFNLWTIVAGIDQKPHTLLLGPITYQLWGQVLFGLSLIPLLRAMITKLTFEKMVWILALTSFSSFMLLTNMHERYLFPLFPYFVVLVVLNKRLLRWFGVVSIISLLNLYNYWFTPRIDFIVSVFDWQGHIVTRVLSLVMVVAFCKLFVEFIRHTTNKKVL